MPNMESAHSAIAVFEDPPPPHTQTDIIRDGYNMITQTLQEPLHELQCEAHITDDHFVVFDVFPFAAGAQRLAFKGSVFERVADREPIFRMHVVVKLEMATRQLISRTLPERTAVTEDEALKTIRKHDRTTYFAEQWCKLGINKSVYVLSTEKIILTHGCALSDIDKQKFPMTHHLFKLLSLDSVLYQDAVGTVEDYLPGRFTKFLNNDGNENNNVTANFPAAFAHWTWVKSGGELMISDIQGVRTSSGYILTDPCVHSTRDPDGYGISDLGMVGIEEFFMRHKCNDLCIDLGLGVDGTDLDLGYCMRTRLRSDLRKSPAEEKYPEQDTAWAKTKMATITEIDSMPGERIKQDPLHIRKDTEFNEGKIPRRTSRKVFERRRSLRNVMDEERNKQKPLRRRSVAALDAEAVDNETVPARIEQPGVAKLRPFSQLFRFNRKS